MCHFDIQWLVDLTAVILLLFFLRLIWWFLTDR